jgi:phage gp36-like protein
MSYCTRTDVEDIFGVENIKVWADLDNDGDAEKILARITRAISWASERVDAAFRHGRYELPLVNDEGKTPLLIVDITSNLAGVWLYENRGVIDFDPNTGTVVHRLIHNKKRAEDMIRNIIVGRLDPGAAPAVTNVVPRVVTDG